MQRRDRHRSGAAAFVRAWRSSASGQLPPSERARIVALLAKAEASSTGEAARLPPHDAQRFATFPRPAMLAAFVAGALAGLVGHAEIYVSGGAEHQGPDGGGPVAIIATPDADRKEQRRAMRRCPRSRALPRDDRHDQDLRLSAALDRTSRSRFPPARSMRCSARTAPASRRSSNASWVSTCRPGQLLLDGKEVDGSQSARRAGARRRHGLSAFHAGAVADGGREPRRQPRRRAGGHRLAERSGGGSKPSSTGCPSACRSTCRCPRWRRARSRSSKS